MEVSNWIGEVLANRLIVDHDVDVFVFGVFFGIKADASNGLFSTTDRVDVVGFFGI